MQEKHTYRDRQGDLLWSLLTACWTHDPQSRPVARQVYTMMKSVAAQTTLRQYVLDEDEAMSRTLDCGIFVKALPETGTWLTFDV
ncbi:hypothetical protein B0J17DRAFT_415952 [Rhizoctonia solani]|nr:hypothetical protein B0J17DRAFT_415952 [Rhizoctonia solani]